MKKIIKSLSTLKDKKILLGLSGGADSTCLFHLLHEAGVPFYSVHINHGLRLTAERDEQFCTELSQKYGHDLKIVEADVREYARLRKLSLEQAGREVRRQTFESFAPDYILLAHHRDDQIETILLNMLRGTGTHGLAGMRKERGQYLRPLLDIPKSEILDYMQEHAYDFVTDETNLETDFTRNFIRLKLIPELQSQDKNFARHLLKLSAKSRKQSEKLDKKTQAWLKGREDGFTRDDFLKLSSELQSLVVRQLWIHLHGSIIGFTRMRATEVIELIDNNIGDKQIQFGNYWVKIKKGQITLAKYQKIS